VEVLDIGLVEIELRDGRGDLGEGQDTRDRPACEQALDLLEFLQFNY
jgi:hypothetical protein